MENKRVVMDELGNALLKMKRPSVFFEELRERGQLSMWFPELEALIDVEQDPVYHPEGNVWNHTMMVLDAAAGLRKDAAEPLAFMIAALVHDFGKVVATSRKKGRIHAYGHEVAGLPLVERFLKRLTDDVAIHKYVLNMTELHMRPNMMIRQKAGRKAFMRMFDQSVNAEDLLLLAKADHLGRDMSGNYEDVERALRALLDIYYERMSRPVV